MEINPAVSVIVPLYNAGKYIGELLDSLLAQTFQNFEAIIVDDCSTDNGVDIVESYAPKFGGRLILAGTDKNSGGGGYVPRNIGLQLSCGKYIFFVDADDFLVETALERLFTVAEDFNTDVLYTAACYSLDESGEIKLEKDMEGQTLQEKRLDDEPYLTVNAPEENIRQLLLKGNLRTPWTKFVRRDFLIKNHIAFPEIFSGGDFIWTIHVFGCAERFLRLPEPLYFYRSYSANSVTRNNRPPAQQISYWIKAFVLWTEALSQIASGIEILKQNPFYCYMATDQHFSICFNRIIAERAQMDSYAIYEALQREFEEKGGAYLISYLFNVIDAQQKRFISDQKHIAELENALNRKD